ncbi:MAG: cell division protein FtsQ/DivIB [Thermoguttaceae bacterium]
MRRLGHFAGKVRRGNRAEWFTPADADRLARPCPQTPLVTPPSTSYAGFHPPMNARKRASRFSLLPRPVAQLARFLVGPGRTFALAALMLILFGAAWYWGWQQVHAEILASAEYLLSPEDIVVTDRPDWMTFDIREKVLRDASLNQNLSIMDPDLNERIASAFALHPWVAKVNRVRKLYPGTVVVDLEYRRPVCVVHSGGQLTPVDVEGNALPAGDLAPNEMDRYPRLVCADLSTRRGPVGEQWGDPRVLGAAEIAAALAGRWQSCHFDRIEILPAPDSNRVEDAVYQLHTRSGTIVIWGHAPGGKVAGDPGTAEKLAYLDDEIHRYGTLEGANDRPRLLDLPLLIANRRTGPQPQATGPAPPQNEGRPAEEKP